MDKEYKVMCDKTLSRKDSVEKNTVENMTIVDALISKSTRKTIEATANKYGFKIQFLYSSDLDGWYDDISHTMYLALDHAMKRPVMLCFDREIKDNHLQCVKGIENKNDLKYVLRMLILCLFVIFVVAGTIYFVFSSESPSEVSKIIGVSVWLVIILLFIVDFFKYDGIIKPLKMKKKEDSSDPVLGTINNCGGMMSLDRIDVKTGYGIYSNYLAFWGVPIIFLGRYLAQEIDTGSWRKKSYKVYGQVETSFKDIYHFYVLRLGGAVFALSIFGGIYKFGSWIGWWS